MKWLIAGLCVVGFIVASISMYYHVADAEESFCNINDKFNCQTVYQSKYSYVLGIPVPLLGMVAYMGFFVLTLAQKPIRNILAFSKKDYWWYLALIATLMLTFQAGLTIISALFIKSFCILCMISQATILAVAASSWLIWKRQ